MTEYLFLDAIIADRSMWGKEGCAIQIGAGDYQLIKESIRNGRYATRVGVQR
jgi:hypothetical protein